MDNTIESNVPKQTIQRPFWYGWTMFLSFAAIVGITSSPLFCYKYTRSNTSRETRNTIVAESSTGERIVLSHSILPCSVLPQPSKKDSSKNEGLSIHCIFCSSGALKPLSIASSFLLDIPLFPQYPEREATRWGTSFFITDSSPRAPPLFV